MEITAALVKELREKTGAAMMDCKKALVETQGDIEAAIETMRKKGVLKAAKKADRTAAEGVVVIRTRHDDANKQDCALVLEVNCETDFVARDTNFLQFVENCANLALNQAMTDIDALSSAIYPGTQDSVDTARQALVAKIGENVQLRRLVYFTTPHLFGAYVHNGRIAALVEMEGGEASLAKDMAMQVAASNPSYLTKDEVSAELIAKEREIFIAQAEKSGKPADIIAKMIDNQIEKFKQESSLLGQAFVKESGKITVAEVLKKANASVKRFVRYQVGEGIEKQADNFAEEVMATAKEKLS